MVFTWVLWRNSVESKKRILQPSDVYLSADLLPSNTHAPCTWNTIPLLWSCKSYDFILLIRNTQCYIHKAQHTNSFFLRCITANIGGIPGVFIYFNIHFH